VIRTSHHPWADANARSTKEHTLTDIAEVTSAALPASAGQLSGGGRVSKQVELVPSNAQLVQTVSVVVPIPTLDTSKGTSANYRCTLSGFSQSMQQWGRFGDLQTVATVFRLTPAPADITGMFNW